MQSSSTSRWRRQLVPTRSKEHEIDIFERGNNHLAEARAEDGRRHEFSLDSLDKEILQTMSRGSKSTHENFPSDSASELSGSTQEKAICSRQSLPPKVVPYIVRNGVHSSESASKTSKEPGEHQHSTSNIGQFQGPPLPTQPEDDARSNGHKQQVSVNVNGGKYEQDPGRWHPSGGPLHRPKGNNDLHVSRLKDLSFRDVHSLNVGLSDTSGEDIGEERRKQGNEGPYAGSMSMFAYPGTPQRLFPGGQRTDAECPAVANVALESPGHERATRAHSTAQYSGGQSQQRSATNSKASKAPPSKWDDAGKWIASPGHNDSATTESARSNQGLTSSPSLLPGMRLEVIGKVLNDRNGSGSFNLALSIEEPSVSLNDGRYTSSASEIITSSADESTSPLNENSTSSISEETSSANENALSLVNGSTSSVRVKDQIKQIESAIQCSLAKDSSTNDLSKRREAPHPGAKCAGDRRDTSVITSTMFVQRPKDGRRDGLVSPPKLQVDPQAAPNPFTNVLPEKPPLAATPTDAPVKDIFSNGSHSRSTSAFPSSISVKKLGTDAAQTTPSICRDMGTQMTPNPSGRLLRGATLGTIFNSSPSRHNTPAQSCRAIALGAPANVDMIDLHMEKVGRSRNLGSQPHPLLDRNLNWSTREEEEEESATCLRTQDCEETQSSPYVAWAAAWEEAERAKYTARFRQEEARIQAWEELQKFKAEVQLKRTKVKLEKMHESASQKMLNKIAAAHRKAEDMRAAAETCREELATKAKHRAEFIRQNGNFPSALGCFAHRLVPFPPNS